MAASSIGFVSKARTAFHSAAAKAEKVFTDIKKSDLDDSDKQSPISRKNEEYQGDVALPKARNARGRPEPIKTKQDWQERLKNIRFGKKGVQETDETDDTTMAFPVYLDENIYLQSQIPLFKESEGGFSAENLDDSNVDIIPSAAVLKQLAIGVETTRILKSMKDLLTSSRDSSPVRERASLSFSSMKSLLLREKEDKFTSEFGTDVKVMSVVNSLLYAEGNISGRKSGSWLEISTVVTTITKDIHGAPPESFVVELAEAIGSLKTLRKMALFWCRVVAELRRLWCEGQYIPGIPPDEIPDLNSCLLYQQLQVINRCISRKRRRAIATESLDSVVEQANANFDQSPTVPTNPPMYARISTGEVVLRQGADKQCEGLTLLETNEPVYAPVMQEEPLLTEDLIKETEEFVLRTGSVGAGCSQLLSDMQAFKAANPGCILEDFVRWHSPPDWMEAVIDDETKELVVDGSSSKGQLSTRMQKEGNLWRELWETAKPVPAVKQTPLYDEDLSVEGILQGLEDIAPSNLFEQLFVSLLSSGCGVAEARLSTNEYLYKLFIECKDYIVATCQGKSWVDKVDDLCEVYETVVMMVSNPDEFMRLTKQQPNDTSSVVEQKGRFGKLSFIFGGKDKNLGKTPPKDPKNSEENPTRQSFSSMFSKKPPKPGSGSPAEKPVSAVENDWTIV